MLRGGGQSVQIRQTRAADIDALAGIEERVFPSDQMSRRSFRRSISSPTMTMLTAVSDGRPVGYALVHRRRGSKVAHLASIAVGPEMAGHGVGSELLRRVETDAARRGAACVRLEVRSDNSVARHLYELAGYHVIATLDGYYEDGTAAIRYEKLLAPRRGPRAGKPEPPHLTA
jgi:ribosomal-protein-alanine acetyltransferase